MKKIVFLAFFGLGGLVNAGQWSNAQLFQSSVSYLFHFNEGYGATTKNHAPNGGLFTLTAGPVWVKGQYGPALKFDSGDPVNGAIVTLNQANMPGEASSRTVLFTMFQATNPATGARKLLCLPCGVGGNSAFQIMGSNNLLAVYHGSNDFTTPLAIPIGIWFGVGVRYSNPNETVFLVTSTSTKIDGFVPGSISTGKSGGEYAIGGDSGQGDCRNCIMDEVAILNRALPNGEIINLLKQAVFSASRKHGDE